MQFVTPNPDPDRNPRTERPKLALTAREVLRQETHDLHEQLDRSTTRRIEEAQSPTEALARYVEVLKTNLQIFAPLEAALYDGELGELLKRFGVAVDSMRKCHHIEADLADLGVAQDEIGALRSLLPRGLQMPTTAPQAAGVMYVLEGSTIGAPIRAVIVTKKVWSGQTTHPFHFYKANGDFREAFARFGEEIVPLLNLMASTDAERAEAVAAARATYQACIDAFGV